MKKLFLIIGVVIFVVAAGFITVEVTKQQIKSITQSITQKETEKVTSGILNKFNSGGIKKLWGNISNKFENIRQVSWAGHSFEVAELKSSYYKSDGKIEWTDNGFIANDFSMPRSKLLDVNMNQKIKMAP